MANTEIILIILFAVKDGGWIQSAKTRLGADCSSGHELLTVKFRLKLKKVGKSTRPFRYAALLLLLLLSHLSRVWLCVTPYTAAYQAPLSMGFSRQEHWSGVPLPSPPFRYDLYQIPYDYTVEVRNTFKGLYLIDRVLDELWTGSWHCVEDRSTPSSRRQCKKAKWLSEEALQIAVKRREAKSKLEKERYTHFNADYKE